MGRPCSLARSGLHESKDTSYFRRVLRDVFLLPNPALLFIAWCPTVWTTCLACHTSGKLVQAGDFFMLLLKNFLVVALIYSFHCTLKYVGSSTFRSSTNIHSNLFNRSSDEDPPRTPSRNVFLFVVYLCRVSGTVATIYYVQGQDFLLLWLPSFIMSSLYPLVKRTKALRQLVLSSSVASVLLPAWISSGRKMEWREEIILIGLFTIFWIIYIDILHKAMDSTHSALASTHYLSPSPTTHLTLTLLSLLQLTTLSIYSYQTHKSPHFWILGVGVWIVNNVWHISDLRNVDWLWNEMSGRVAVQRNIWLGLWLCGAEVCELWVGGGLGF
ncbi:hypothetical protein BKA65DRAFT_95053 [Rhexocercosporidium sp. MPI-PUGE-AT-0058]|nr:hypothetical protein BKA65DRAFT_95053 [Rhexocercosporidium sp. MPI-PUGE-AT-0058]